MNVNYMVYVVKYFSIYNNQNLFFVIFTLKTLNIEIREMLPPFKKLKIKKNSVSVHGSPSVKLSSFFLWVFSLDKNNYNLYNQGKSSLRLI